MSSHELIIWRKLIILSNKTITNLLEATNSTMADVLSVIREYNVSKKDIEERDELVVFGNKAWKKTAKTNYVAYG